MLPNLYDLSIRSLYPYYEDDAAPVNQIIARYYFDSSDGATIAPVDGGMDWVSIGTSNSKWSTTTNVDTTGAASADEGVFPQDVFEKAHYKGGSGTATFTETGLVAGGDYLIQIGTMEGFFTTANSREFNVTINGVLVLEDYDIVEEVGNKDIPVIESFYTQADGSGEISIEFDPTTNNFAVRALQITQIASACSVAVSGSDYQENLGADVDFNITVLSMPTSDVEISIRYVDDDNRVLIVLTPAGELELFEVTGGVYTLLSATGATISAQDVIRVTSNSSNEIKVYDGILTPTLSQTITINPTEDTVHIDPSDASLLLDTCNMV